MLKVIDGETWFCCPQCGQKIHPVKPGARGVLVACKARKCEWRGEIRWDAPPELYVPMKQGAGWY